MIETQRRRVAIVDDNLAVRDSLRFLLEVTGHAVETFASAAEYLDADTRHMDCLILDHHMPTMTGLELTARLRADGARIPILLITGSPTPALLARAADLGICKVVEKPASEDDLLAFIDAKQA